MVLSGLVTVILTLPAEWAGIVISNSYGEMYLTGTGLPSTLT